MNGGYYPGKTIYTINAQAGTVSADILNSDRTLYLLQRSKTSTQITLIRFSGLESLPMNASQISSGMSAFSGECRGAGGHSAQSGAAAKSLSREEMQEVQELKTRDREVRAHEAAHMAAGGQHVRGGATFEYQTGPDGRRYAVGGEVSIDTSPVKGDPKATVQKMQAVRKAALAPAQPSAQDRAVAAKAAQEEAKARQQLLQQQDAELSQPGGDTEHAEKSVTSGYTRNARPACAPDACGIDLLV